MLADLEGEEQILDLLFARRTLGDDLEIVFRNHPVVAALNQQSAGDALVGHAGGGRIGQRAGDQKAQVLLGRDHLACIFAYRRRNDHLGHQLDDFLGGRAVEFLVEGDDATEGRNRIAAQGLAIGVHQRVRHRHAAGIGVLDDGAGRFAAAEFADQFEGRVGIIDIVVGELLALQELGARHTRTGVSIDIEGRFLVRVLAIAHDFAQAPAEGAVARRFQIQRLGEPAGNRGIIGRGARIGERGEFLAQAEPERAAVRFDRVRHPVVIGRIGDDADIGVVLGRRTDHRRPADIDVLDHGGVIAARGAHVLEGIEIDHRQIDGADIVGFHRGGVFGVVADRQQAAMHTGMQRLHPAIHDFRKAGQFRDVADG